MTTYHVRAHNDHYHVLDDTSDVLDDRPTNHWRYAERSLAEQVATLLNSGMEPSRVKAMDAYQIDYAYTMAITGGS